MGTLGELHKHCPCHPTPTFPRVVLVILRLRISYCIPRGRALPLTVTPPVLSFPYLNLLHSSRGNAEGLISPAHIASKMHRTHQTKGCLKKRERFLNLGTLSARDHYSVYEICTLAR